MEDEAALLKQVFGDSSDDEIHGDYINRSEIGVFPAVEGGADPLPAENLRWESVEEVTGLWICRDFLSPERQLRLLSAIQSEGWFREGSHNQAMRFGDLPSWVNGICISILEALLTADILSGMAPSDKHEEDNLFPILSRELLSRQPLFDQLIANLYHQGQGICAHVDLMRFDDGIAIISLESPCVMHFSPASADIPEDDERKVPVYLNPGSLVIMSGEARYCWKHEINRKPGFQVWDGKELEQKRRISLTLRKLARAE